VSKVPGNAIPTLRAIGSKPHRKRRSPPLVLHCIHAIPKPAPLRRPNSIPRTRRRTSPIMSTPGPLRTPRTRTATKTDSVAASPAPAQAPAATCVDAKIRASDLQGGPHGAREQILPVLQRRGPRRRRTCGHVVVQVLRAHADIRVPRYIEPEVRPWRRGKVPSVRTRSRVSYRWALQIMALTLAAGVAHVSHVQV